MRARDTAVFTIIAPNYRHYARVLMASLREHHPDWERFVLVVDRTSAGVPVEEGFTTVTLAALPLPSAPRFCFRYNVLELSTAVKPWMLEHLFQRGFDRVIFLDPDTRVFSPLVELDAVPAATLMTLTPHLTGGIPGDGHPSERAILQAGAYNLGFLAVSRRPQLAAFLAWWQEKLEHQCVSDTSRGLMLDQKWMDLAPGMFADVEILRHEGYNVAYWNLGQRSVEIDGDRVTVNGQPLRFFHFSGFNPAAPELISKYSAQTLAEIGDAARIFEEYRAAVRAAGEETFRHARYPLGFFADGTPVSDAARLAYRASPTLQSACGGAPFEHPEAFAGIDGSGAQARWARWKARVRPAAGLLPGRLRSAARRILAGVRGPVRSVQLAGAPPRGVNLVGYLGHDTGVGQVSRLFQRALDSAAIPHHDLDVDRTFGEAGRARYRASVYCVNADQTLALRERMPAVFAASSCNIGCWNWELPELPDGWIAAAEALDEIWAPSAFVQGAIAAKATIPVVHMPYGVEVTEIEPCSPAELGVPSGRFTFLCMFDLLSVVERKNPWGAVEAFRRAFPREGNVALLVKAGHAGREKKAHADLERRLAGVANVTLTDRMLPRPRLNGLLAACDAVVSLHRSEGFGLILAEAMSLGKPVVATGWSGNMDFMDAGNSCPVAHDLVTLDRSHGPYAAGQTWAEPDLEHAAHLMRRVVEDPAFRARIGARAQHTIRTQFSPAAAGRRYRQRLAILGLAAALVPSVTG